MSKPNVVTVTIDVVDDTGHMLTSVQEVGFLNDVFTVSPANFVIEKYAEAMGYAVQSAVKESAHVTIAQIKHDFV